MKKFFLFITIALCGMTFTSCSESTDDDEYANWTERNDNYIDSIAAVANKSVLAGDGEWKIIKNWKLQGDGLLSNGTVASGSEQDYIYCKVISSGDQTSDTPLYTDSVGVNYIGRLIPTTSYPEGLVFDQSYYGELKPTVDVPTTFIVSGVITGWTTALQYMHLGDTWKIYIPQNLGYGSSGSGSTIKAYSTLIFDVNLQKLKHRGDDEWIKYQNN